jgi:hypothetical protein
MKKSEVSLGHVTTEIGWDISVNRRDDGKLVLFASISGKAVQLVLTIVEAEKLRGLLTKATAS